MRMDVVGLSIMRSQTTSYLSCVNTCLTGLGASATDPVSLNLSMSSVHRFAMRHVRFGEHSANVCVFICTTKHVFNQEHSSLLWQHHFHNTSVHRKWSPFTAQLIDGRLSSRSDCFVIHVKCATLGACALGLLNPFAL